MSRAVLAACAVALAGALFAPLAAGSPAADSQAIVRDYSNGRDITNCRFTRGQLENALNQIGADIDSYAPGLRGAIRSQIRRWRNGDCKRTVVLRIVKVAPQGDSDEYVTIRNVSRRTVKLRGYQLRDAADHTIRLRATSLKPKRSLRIVTGCRAGHRQAVRRGARYYACRSTPFWDDAGDVVELLTPQGGLLSTKRY